MNITLKNITKLYDGHPALIDCSIVFEKGGFTTIIGPNGSGKSTLLRIAALLEEPESGRVIYRDDATVLKNDIALRRKIAVVLPGDSLFNDTVFNNVAYGLRIRRTERHIITDKVYNILKRFRLEERARKHIRTLSSGEAQRVAVARALIVEPEYLFLDEPTASLDPVNTEIIESVLVDANRNKGITIVMITHNMFQARRLGNRVVFMYGGRIVEEADCEKIFTSPESNLTGSFITGTMVW
jgi:tungstate transport system ATP-binding protein